MKAHITPLSKEKIAFCGKKEWRGKNDFVSRIKRGGKCRVWDTVS